MLPNPRFDLIDLRLFVRVAEASSLTQGAAQSALSLPAVSLRIKNLEDALGTQLLYRSKRGVTPTPAGGVFLDHARAVLAEVEQLQAQMQPFSRGVRGHVRLFANTTAIAELLPEVLAKFFEVYRDISVDLQERLSPEIVRAVHEGVADVGIVSALPADGLETLPYCKNPLVLAVPIDHPLAAYDCVQFSETLQYDFVWLDARSATYSFLQQEVSQSDAGMRQRVLVGNFDAMCRMVEAKVGIGVMSEIAARRHGRSARIKLIGLTDPWADRELRICVRKLRELPVFARELIEFILEAQ